MAEEPTIIGRAAAREFPSELPEQLPRFPGKPLAHRFTPTQQPRIAEEPNLPGQTRLASSTPFIPIASFAYPGKNVYLGPVRNVRARGLQPVALQGNVTLPIPEQHPLEVTEELRGPLEARLGRLSGQEQTAQVGQPPDFEGTPETTVVPFPNPAALTELEKLKAAAGEELARRVSPSLSLAGTLAAPQPPLPPTEQAIPQGTDVILPKLAIETQPSMPLATDFEEAPGETEDKTKKLLSEAEKLETELSTTLKQITGEKQHLRTAQEQREKETDYLAQISQLVTDRNALLKQVNELAAARKEADNKLEVATEEFTRQTQELKIGRTNLAEQVKTLEQKIEGLQQKQEQVKETSSQVATLQNQLAVAEKERDSTREQVKKLQNLLLELQEGVKVQAAATKVVEPQVVSPPAEAETRARVVKPQVAIGKMAPSITTAPNVINGIIKDAAGYLLSNVIIVVKDKPGEPVRALKTNKIGQFAISTPLPNGTYTMELEAEGHNFDIVQVELEGKVLPPLEIRANE